METKSKIFSEELMANPETRDRQVARCIQLVYEVHGNTKLTEEQALALYRARKNR